MKRTIKNPKADTVSQSPYIKAGQPNVLKDQGGKEYYSADYSDILQDLAERAHFLRVENFAGGGYTPPKDVLEKSAASKDKVERLYRRGFVRAQVDSETILRMSEDIIDGNQHATGGNRHWMGGTLQEWEERKWSPDPDAVSAATTLFDKLDRSVNLEHHRPAIRPSVVGSSPRVAAFLSGSPQSMRRRVQVETAGAVVRLFVGMNTAAHVRASEMRQRGVAVMALARAMQQVAPVEVWACFGSQLRIVDHAAGVTHDKRRYQCSMVRVSLAPMDLSRSSRLLADPYFKRGVLHCMNRRLAGKWGKEGFDSFPFPDIGLDTIVGAQRNDLLIPGMYDDLRAATDSEAWVKEELEKWLSGRKDSLARKGFAVTN